MNDADYPIVHVNADGTVREVSVLEKLYLQTEFSGGDDARPCIRTKYRQRGGTGSLEGFCFRNAVPAGTEIRLLEDKASKEEIIAEIERIRPEGYGIDLSGIDIG